MSSSQELDFLIVGAGISGIGAACHLVRECPDKTFAILEQRDTMGGTWDIFRYPGVRCDSDMFTLGYSFRPWPTDAVITDGQSILDYLEDTARAFGVDQKIRYGHAVQGCSWSSMDAVWTVNVSAHGEPRTYRARFLVMCPGYFRYEAGHTPEIPGLDTFDGPVIHPQFWPDDYDHDGQRVVVIGSGATAVTIVPSMADTGAHVTMLQRSPTYYLSLPSTDATVRAARRLLPDDWVSRATLVRNTLLQFGFYHLCRRYPERARRFLLEQVRSELGDEVDMRHFTPRYKPWDERICAVPDGDLFRVLREGTAEVVTDHIERVEQDGILLQSGRKLDADAIVTATGFELRLFGGIDMEVDGEVVDPTSRVLYNAAMIDGVPNCIMIFGYSNVSWTRKVDVVSRYLCRLARHMDAIGADVVTPSGGDRFESEESIVPLMSGFVKRAKGMFPKQGTQGPWRTRNNVVWDTLMCRYGNLNDGHLVFRA